MSEHIEKGEWRDRAPAGPLGSVGLAHRAEWTIDVLRKSGHYVHPSGRLPAALRLLGRLNKGELLRPDSDPTLLRLVAAAHRTAWEFFFITQAAYQRRGRANTPFAREKFELMLGGGEEEGGSNQIARNTQFELFTAAMLVHGGLEVRRGEPDLRFLYGHQEVGIAAKRMSSQSQRALIKRFKEGADQIERSKRPGFVAFNLDVHLHEARLDRERADLLKDFEEAFDRMNVLFERFRGRSQILGLLAFGYVTQWDFPDSASQPPFLRTAQPWRFAPVIADPAERLFVKELMDGWGARLGNSLDRLGGLTP